MEEWFRPKINQPHRIQNGRRRGKDAGADGPERSLSHSIKEVFTGFINEIIWASLY